MTDNECPIITEKEPTTIEILGVAIEVQTIVIIALSLLILYYVTKRK